MSNYTLNPDLFSKQLAMTRPTGEGWDFEHLATIHPDALARAGETNSHLAYREGREYLRSVPGEDVAAFSDRVFTRIVQQLSYTRPPIAESRSLGLFA